MKFKLSKSRAKEFAKKMEETSKKYSFISTPYPIREGSFVGFYSIAREKEIYGVVKISSYGGGHRWDGESRNLHFFTILQADGKTVRVRGKNLYPFLIEHKPALSSRLETFL